VVGINPESVDDIFRNGWTIYLGTGGRN